MPQRRDKLLRFDARVTDDVSSAMRVEPRIMAFLAVTLLLVAVAGWLYLYQTSQVAGYAQEIRELQEQEESLRQEISALRAQVALDDSLDKALELGREMGYSLPPVSQRDRYLALPVDATLVITDGASYGDDQADFTVRPDWGERVLERLDEWITTPVDKEAQPQ